MSLTRICSTALLTAIAAASLSAQAQIAPKHNALAASPAPMVAGEAILMRGPAGAVTVAQLQAAVQFLVPPAQRESFYAKPQNIEQLVLSIYSRQALAQQAKQQGFDREEGVSAILAFAQQQSLSDLWLLKQTEAKEPTAAQLEQYARSVYNAQPTHVRDSLQLKVRHIVVSTSPTQDDSQARAKAEKLLADLKAGASFEALARDESSDASSAANGGELPPFTIGQYRSRFEIAAQNLSKPGDISEVVQGQQGYHIIQLIERKVESGFERQREALIEQARAKLRTEARAELFKAAQAGAEPDTSAISALVREPASK